MSNFKCRAWDTRNNQMVYSKNFVEGDCFYVNTKGLLFMYAIPHAHPWEESTYHKDYDNVMIYIGLQDKSGVDIYAGDIVAMEEGIIGITILIDGCFKFQCVPRKYGFFSAGNCSEIVEIIGNIYENPELLGDNDE